ncbi:MAG TPA: hypothetical protein VFX49_03905 [Chloroflexota bacterium]|nr:hypothetical protein [Chloroflexota bacterium]
MIAPGDTHFGVNESFNAAVFGWRLGARWTRWIVEWSEVQRYGEGTFNSDDDRNTYNIDAETLRQDIRFGYKVMAVLKSTPAWAQADPTKAVRSVPRGLDLPIDDPGNTWAAFVRWMASRYAGRIDTWAIWNEVEIPATGPNAVYNTWAGTLEQYYRLLKVAWQVAHQTNPNARIVLSPYSYHRDKEWLQKLLRVAARDPEAAANGFFFDVVGLNLYRNPHDLWDRKVGQTPWAADPLDRMGVDQQLAQAGLKKPVWVTEVNAMPYDDPGVPAWDAAQRNDGFRITLDEQASFVIQAYALGIAAGYETIFWQAMQDDPPPVPDELWGLVRYSADSMNADPERARPAYTAYQVAARFLSSADRVELLTVDRADPANYRRFAPRYQWWVHQVCFQRGTDRTTVLWNGAGTPARVALPRAGQSATLVDKRGAETPLEPGPPAAGASASWAVTLPGATRHFNLFGGDPPGYFYVGGSPLLVVERGVPADAPFTRVAVL